MTHLQRKINHTTISKLMQTSLTYEEIRDCCSKIISNYLKKYKFNKHQPFSYPSVIATITALQYVWLYIVYRAPIEEINAETMLQLLLAGQIRYDDPSFKNAVDLMFDELAQENPEHDAIRIKSCFDLYDYYDQKNAYALAASALLNVIDGEKKAYFDTSNSHSLSHIFMKQVIFTEELYMQTKKN